MRKTKNKGFACSSEKSCQNCGNCLYICEGDFLCEAEEEVVLTEWNEPTDKYMACGGRRAEMGAFGMIRVYICSPFRAADDEGRKRNVDYAKELVKQAVNRGWAPFAPHLYLPGVLDDADAEQREAGMRAGLAFLETCDAVIVGAKYGISEGMAREIRYAKALGIPRKDASEEG